MYFNYVGNNEPQDISTYIFDNELEEKKEYLKDIASPKTFLYDFSTFETDYKKAKQEFINFHNIDLPKKLLKKYDYETKEHSGYYIKFLKKNENRKEIENIKFEITYDL